MSQLLTLLVSPKQTSGGQIEARERAKAWLAFVLFFVLIAACYLPVLNPNYAVSDDFYHLARSMRVSDWFSSLMMVTLLQGRPLDGLLLGLGLSNFHAIGNFVALRLAGIIGAAALAFCSYLLLVKCGWQRVQAFCMAICFVTVPAFQVFVSWSIAALYVFPAFGAYYSVVLAERSLHLDRIRKWIALTAACLCLFLALSLYQPSSMFFWLFVSIFAFSARDKPINTKMLFAMLTVFAVSVILDVATFDLAKHYFGTASVLPQRSHFSTDVVAKIRWFVCGPLVDALNFSRLQPSSKLAMLNFWCIAVGLLFYFRGGMVQKILNTSMALLFIPLTYLPNLAIAENFVTYRTQAALTPLLIFYAFLAYAALSQSMIKNLSEAVATLVPITACIASLLFANYNVTTYFVIPQVLELRLMKSQLSGEFGEKRQSNPLSLTRDDTLARCVRYDEFGLPSLAQPWVPEPVTFLLRQQLNNSDLPSNPQKAQSNEEFR
jgi:hypothetical protein